jgi:predicted permease
LLAVCGLILAAACLNIANLLIGYAVSRRKEIAVRVALGASRRRIIQQLLVEALLIGSGGAGLGMLVSLWFAAILAVMPRHYLNLPPTASSLTTAGAIDARLLAVAGILGIACAVAFGLLPALLASFRNPTEDLKSPRPSWTWCGTRVTWRQLLLVAQVTLAVVLAVTAGLYGRSFIRIAALAPEYRDPNAILVARIVPPPTVAQPGDPFYRDLLPRVRALPGVMSASMGWNPPLMIGRGFVSLPDRDEVIEVAMTAGASRFFETHGVQVVAGREFDDSEHDIKNSLIVNRTLADRLFGTKDPIGQPVTMTNERRTIVGVVAYERCNGIATEPGPCAWRPYPMSGLGYIRIRTAGPPLPFAEVLRRTVHDLNPDVAVAEEISLAAWLDDLTQAQRKSALASAGLAVVGVLLLVVGSGALFFSMVKDSTREIAIRQALGCSHLRLTGRILLQGTLLMAAGLATGVVAAWFIAHRIADQLYRTPPSDLPTFLTIPVVVGLAGLAAVYWSVRIATRIEPAEFLRTE